MNPYIKNPKILLLKCSIEYLYREETKFTCIDPIVLQVNKSLSLQLMRDNRENNLLTFFFVFLSGTRVFEELCSAHSGCPPKPGVGGEDSVSYCSGHAARARHHTGHQC